MTSCCGPVKQMRWKDSELRQLPGRAPCAPHHVTEHSQRDRGVPTEASMSTGVQHYYTVSSYSIYPWVAKQARDAVMFRPAVIPARVIFRIRITCICLRRVENIVPHVLKRPV